MQKSTNDWAYLGRFQAENEILKMHSNENRVVFIGDSIIAGWKQHSLFVENSNYINRGINGQTTSQILHRFAQDVIDLKPKQVVILVGTNDIAENNGPISLKQIQANFVSMIEIARANRVQIILCSILPVKEYYWNKTIQPLEKIKTLNNFLASLSNKENIYFIDFYTQMSDNNAMKIKLTDDGVHPNTLGYDVMSELLKKSDLF